jgi:N-acetylglucosaminyl-diphospho-decaprenol L-rhamnosyltransferase
LTPLSDRVAAVVVNYNAGDHLLDCARSLREAGVDHVIVADNASIDDSIARLRAAEPTVTVVETGANFGYGGGVNRGVAAVGPGPDVILVCNADLVLERDAVTRLVESLDADSTLGLVGPRIDNSDGTLYPSARTFPHLIDAIGHAFFGMIAPSNRFTRRYRLLDWDHKTARRVDWVSGACFAIRRELFDRIGGFDEDYFMYLEDVDICRRANAAGAAVAYEPDARVIHVQGVSTEQLPYRMLAAHHRSILRWWWSSNRGVKRLLVPFVAGGLAVRFGLAAALRLVQRGK